MRAASDSSTAGASKASQPWVQGSTRCPGGSPWQARQAGPHPSASYTPRTHHLIAQPRAGGNMWHVVLLLGLLVVCNSLAYAPHFVGPTTSGYVFALNDPTPFIIRGGAAELIVSVHNAQGQPVANLPVTFQVEPGWAQSASVFPQVAYTRQGMAHALFQARTIGVVHVTVQVDNATQEARITVASRPSPTGE